MNQSTAASITLTLTPTSGENTTFGGVLQNSSGTLSLTLDGPGTQVLAGSNTYIGSTTITEGTLQIGSGGASGTIGSGTSTIAVSNANAMLAYDLSVCIDPVAERHRQRRAMQLGTGTLVLTGTNDAYNGTTMIGSSATLQLGSGAAAGSLSGTARHRQWNAGVRPLRFADLFAYHQRQRRRDANGRQFAAPLGHQQLHRPDHDQRRHPPVRQHRGPGELVDRVDQHQRCPGPRRLLADDRLAGRQRTVTNTAASGTSTLTLAPLLGSTATFSGVIQNGSSGVTAFTLNGPGTEVFSGANSYTGPITITAGTLQVGSGGTAGTASGAGTGPITDNGMLAYDLSGPDSPRAPSPAAAA